MVIKVSANKGLNFKMFPSIFSFLFNKEQGDIHYIGGNEVLPPPLETYEENCAIDDL